MERKSVCSICGEQFPVDALISFAGEHLCEHCLNEETIVCADCGSRIWNDSNAGSDDHPLCQRCYDSSYTTCERCGRLLLYDDACYLNNGDEDYPYCESCYQQLRRGGIHSYDYKPLPIFYGVGPRYFGVELEIDGAGECDSNADKILAIGNHDEPRVYCKHDGSLDEGFEIVSYPATLDSHMHSFPWEQMMREAVAMGYCSHQATTCGLHVHISRDAFGRTEQAQEAAIARLLFFVEKHWNELLKFSRRTNRQLERWAARYGYKDTPKEMMDHAKSYHYGRYTCVNLTNTETVEIRIFRGTLKYNTFIATLQLVNRLCDVAIYLTDSELHAMSWSDFTAGITEPELIQYLKERRLYLNEPVESEVEL